MSSIDFDANELAIGYSLELCLFGATTMLVYDMMISIDKEVEVVWSRRPSLVTVVHVLNRYMEILAYLAALILLLPVSDQTCSRLGLFESVSTMLPYIAWAVFSGFRVYALSGRRTSHAITVFVLTSFYIAPDFYETIYGKFVNSSDGCQQLLPLHPDIIQSLLWSSRASAFAGESIVLFWTLKETYRAWGTREKRPRSISDVVFKNGILCFSIPLAINAITLALNIVSTPRLRLIGQCIIAFRDAISSILISRFLFDLGVFKQEKVHFSGSAREVLTTQFLAEFSESTAGIPAFVNPHEEDTLASSRTLRVC